MAMSVVYTTVNGTILSQAKGGVVSHFVPDPLGSVVMVRDTSGNTVYEAEYDPYGNVQSETGTNPSSLGYVGTLGYIKDSVTSMYVRARYLLNNLGRWLTKDPLWPSESGFVYAEAAPNMWVDPSGETCQAPQPYPESKCNERNPTVRGACIAIMCSMLASGELVNFFRQLPIGGSIGEVIDHHGNAGPGPLASASDCCEAARKANKNSPITIEIKPRSAEVKPNWPNIIGRICTSMTSNKNAGGYCAFTTPTAASCATCCERYKNIESTYGMCNRFCGYRFTADLEAPLA